MFKQGQRVKHDNHISGHYRSKGTVESVDYYGPLIKWDGGYCKRYTSKWAKKYIIIEWNQDMSSNKRFMIVNMSEIESAAVFGGTAGGKVVDKIRISHRPSVLHKNRGAAEQEALRLCVSHGVPFAVFETCATAEPPEKPTAKLVRMS